MARSLFSVTAALSVYPFIWSVFAGTDHLASSGQVITFAALHLNPNPHPRNPCPGALRRA